MCENTVGIYKCDAFQHSDHIGRLTCPIIFCIGLSLAYRVLFESYDIRNCNKATLLDISKHKLGYRRTVEILEFHSLSGVHDVLLVDLFMLLQMTTQMNTQSSKVPIVCIWGIFVCLCVCVFMIQFMFFFLQQLKEPFCRSIMHKETKIAQFVWKL